MKENTKKIIRNVLLTTTVVEQVLRFAVKKKEIDFVTVGEYMVQTICEPSMDYMVACTYSTDTIEKDEPVEVNVDGLFTILPTKLKKCILAHELGHHLVKGGIPENMFSYTLTHYMGLSIYPKEEIAADSYVTKIYGRRNAILMALFLFAISPSPETIARIIAILIKR